MQINLKEYVPWWIVAALLIAITITVFNGNTWATQILAEIDVKQLTMI